MLLPIILAAATAAPSPLVEQIDDTGFYQLESPSLAALGKREKMLAFWLNRAAIAIDPIIYDQLSTFGVKEKRLIGALIEDPNRLPAETRPAIVKFAKLFFANRGNHNETTNQKLLPEFTFEQFQDAVHAAQTAGAPLGDPAKLDALLQELKQPLFDPAFEPSLTTKTPPAGKDIITASSTNFYGPGVTLADLKEFHDANPLNSRVVKEDGKLAENVYRAGTPDGAVPPGLYAKELGAAIIALGEAKTYADKPQQEVLAALIRYFQTGSPDDWHTFNVAWVQNDANVDFVNGFIETYRDARAAKGAAQSLVCVKDRVLNPLMQKLAQNALYFEKKAPWADTYRKLDVKPPVGKAVEAIVETADFGVSTIGDNLPNEEEIHQKYGTKNFLISNASDAFNRTRGLRVVQEFMPGDVARYQKVGSLSNNLVTAMHEIIGHGSGKSRTQGAPRETLREFYSTLEEARADLMAYWNANDPKLAALGVQNPKDVAGEMYASMARSIFGVLNHYPKSDVVEEDHDRDRLMIWNWVHERGGIGLVEKDGKHYAAVLDLEKAHKAVGELLAELMRIKGEGEYDAIKALVEKYGLHFDTQLRDEVVARYKALGLPRYSAGMYGHLEVVKKDELRVSYPRDFLKQQVAFAKLNGTLGFAAAP